MKADAERSRLPWRSTDTEESQFALPPREGAVGLWVGQRADSSDAVVILPHTARALPAVVVIETGNDLSLAPDDDLHVKFREVFSRRMTSYAVPLRQGVPPGAVARIEMSFALPQLACGYYLVVADVRRGGRSLLGGRVGADDFYLRDPGESMTYTVLSVRTGMVQWVRDLIYGNVMVATRSGLPHVYDPLSRRTYAHFLRLFASDTSKHVEGNEAGATGLALAAEAFRKSGHPVRQRFAESLLDDSSKHMIAKMQAPSGGVIAISNELRDAGIGRGLLPHAFGSYDSNQIGEFMRALAYAVIHYRALPRKRAWARQLSAACRRAADYLVAHAAQKCDGLPDVLRHLTLSENPDGSVEQVAYYEEGRQCDVYLGRALAGLSYYAYAMQLLGDEVPDRWWRVMGNTLEWACRKMKPNGWFDWQCEDIVERGCHTFLGNTYIGEGMFGVHLAARQAGRLQLAERAAAATLKAYHYVTDHCAIRGISFRDYFGATDLWVGPYVYWLFTEYLDTVSPDQRLHEWLRMLDDEYSVRRGWRDFLDRPRDQGNWRELYDRPRSERDYAYRASCNGMLVVGLLGYLAIKHMEEIGKPLHWPLPSLARRGRQRCSRERIANL
jgi:hypothetical protein